MPWIAAIGVAAAGAFGATVAAGSLAAMVVGGVIVGAAVGALYSAVSGGHILKGALYGVLGGAVLGAGGAALGFGTSVGGGPAALAGGSAGAAPAAFAAAQATQGVGILGSTGTVVSQTAESLFTTEGLRTAGTAMSLGAAFLHGGMTPDIDPDANRALREKEIASREKIAKMQAETSKEKAEGNLGATFAKIKSNEEIAFAKLDQDDSQFNKKFDFETLQYEEEKAETEKRKGLFEKGIIDAAKYVRGNSKSATVSQVNKQRRSLPGPVWWDKAQDKETTQPTGILSTGATA